MCPEACVALMVVQMTTAVILKLFFFFFPHSLRVDHIATVTGRGLMRAFGVKTLRGQSHKVPHEVEEVADISRSL